MSFKYIIHLYKCKIKERLQKNEGADGLNLITLFMTC